MGKEITAAFLEAIRRTHNVTSFRFDDRGEADFRPGQFFQIFLRGKEEELSHYFSFSNSPTEKGYIEFTKKLSPSPFSRALLKLKPGDLVRLRLPLGQFIFEGQFPRAAFLSGGIGITPIRSICKFLTDSNSAAEVIVLYSARTIADFVFRDDFDRMQERNRNLSVVYSITDQKAPAGWQGRTGRISPEMVKEEVAGYRERVFYVCGPPAMVTALTTMLKESLGIYSERVVCENFSGY